MLIVRLVHLKEMPSYEELLKSLKENSSNFIDVNNDITTEQSIEKKNLLKETNEMTKISKDQIKNTIQTKPILSSPDSKKLSKGIFSEQISSFEELILLSSKKKEIQLKYDLENNVNLIKFTKGKIDISFNENLDKNFVRNLSTKLHEWTGIRWVITLTKKPGEKTFAELKNIEKRNLIDKEKKSETYKKFKNIFSDGELLDIKKKN